MSLIVRFRRVAEDWLSGCLTTAHGCERFELLVACSRGVAIALFQVTFVAACACCTSRG